MTVFYVILAILLFGILILAHEFGHFITAKLFGVRVNEFALFMGPAIWKKTKGETTYSLRCIPIGGFCAMEGEDDDSDDPRSFGKAKAWKRLIILVAGATMNFIVGFLMALIVFGTVSQYFATNTVESIEAGRPFYSENGLQIGDEIYSINDRRVYVNSNISMLLDRDTDGTQDLVVIRDGEKVELKDLPIARDYEDEDGSLRYGFSFAIEEKTLGSLLSYTWRSSKDFARLVWMGLEDIFTGRAGVKDMGGPVQIVQIVTQQGTASESIGLGIADVVYLFAFISINLGVMNLLPVPALDGGRAVCLLLTAGIEKITRKKINPKYEAYLHGGFMILLLIFMALITFKDVFQLFGG